MSRRGFLCSRVGRVLSLSILAVLVPHRVLATVTLLVGEPITSGFASGLHGGGHASVYLSNICSDDSATVRPCRAGEEGIVVGTYGFFTGAVYYYWMAMPLTVFLYGIETPEQAPIYANQTVLTFLQRQYAKRRLDGRLPGFEGDISPEGSWQFMIGNVMRRNVYALSLETTPEEDRRAIDALNGIQGRQRFDMYYNNCSDFSRFVLNTYFPGAVHRDLLNDFTFTSPKAIARALTSFGRTHPERRFEVTKYRQIDGPIGRSQPNRSLTEKAVTSPKYLAMSLATNPFVTAAFAATYELTGRFSFESAVNASRRVATDSTNHLDQGLVASTRTRISTQRSTFALWPQPSRRDEGGAWPEYRDSFRRLVNEATRGGLCQSERELKDLAANLESSSTPEYDAVGDLRLRVGDGDEARPVSLTRNGMLEDSSDPRLSYELMMSVVAAELAASRSHRPTVQDFKRDWQLLLALHDRPGVWDPPTRSSGSANGTPRLPGRHSPRWKRVLAFMMR